MRGQRGWRELAVLGDKINKFTGMIEGFIWSPRSGDSSEQQDDWAFEEVYHIRNLLAVLFYTYVSQFMTIIRVIVVNFVM